MSDLAARFVYSPLPSTAFKVVCLFCVLGLALSLAIVPMIAPEYLAGRCPTSNDVVDFHGPFAAPTA